MNRNVELCIEKLVLHGFPPSDRARIGGAVEQELARLLTGRGVPSSLAREGEMPRLDGLVFDIAPGSTAETIGAQVAQAVYGGLPK